VARFLRDLRDAASAVNPAFRVITRLESFYGERKHLWPLLRDRLDGRSELAPDRRAGRNNYPHPSYKDVQVLGAAYHHNAIEKERGPAESLRPGEAGRSFTIISRLSAISNLSSACPSLAGA